MYSKKEVVELTDDLLKHLKIDRDSFTGDRIISFLKEKGLIESELEIGKWYHYGTDLLVWNGGRSTYGFSQGVDYLNNAYFTVDEAIPATDKEVEEALIKEAKKRGFNEGVKIKGFVCSDEEVSTITEGFVYSNGELRVNCSGDYYTMRHIFEDGKWAEIIEDVNDTNVADIGNEEESYSHTFTCRPSNTFNCGTSFTHPSNEIKINGETYVKK